jgi:UDP-glucose 4-epimerase
MMPTYLVTGGCGFIGSHLCEALIANGHQVRVLDDLSTGKLENMPAAADFIKGDVGEPGTVMRAMQDVDGCFHLAAVASIERGHRDWLGTHRTNLTGAIAVFDAARAGGRQVPVVYASSAAVFGNNPNMPLTEEAATRPLSAYGADKLGCEQHAFVAARVHNVPTCGLRFFNVYGPRQDPTSPYSGVISIFCDRLRGGRSITIHGDGLQKRDFIFVEDVVRALIAAMARTSGEAPVYNICTGRATSLLQLTDVISVILNTSAKIEHGPSRLGDVRESFGDPSRARAELGFEARTDLRVGLIATLGKPASGGEVT